MPSDSYCTMETIHTKEIKCVFASNSQMQELNPVNGVVLFTALFGLSNFSPSPLPVKSFILKLSAWDPSFPSTYRCNTLCLNEWSH